MKAINVIIVDYGVGNLQSVKNAFLHNGSCVARVSDDPKSLREADAIVLPGVGAFREGIEMLRKKGFVELLNTQVLQKKTPILAVCLGMQFLMDSSEEGGDTLGLGWISGRVSRFSLSSDYRIPHMGWNNLDFSQQANMFKGITRDKNFYFAHSYIVNSMERDQVLATCHYGHQFPAAVRKENIIGLQFHPEKSHHNGLIVIDNFIDLAREY